MQYERELRLGGLVLAGPGALMHSSGCSFATVAKGVKFGSAEAEKSIAKAFGGRGSRVSVDHWGNGVTVFVVEISAPDAVTLARGQAALERVLPDGSGGTVDLLWRPHPEAPAAVRDVVFGELVEQYDDDSESRLVRVFELTLTHKPFVRSEFPTSLPVQSGSGSHAQFLIDNGGTRPTSAVVGLSSSGGALGPTLVHVSSCLDFDPDVSHLLSSASGSGVLWHSLSDLDSPTMVTLPARQVPHRSYSLVALLKSTSTQTVPVSVHASSPPPDYTQEEGWAWAFSTSTADVSPTVFDRATPVPIGVVSLPPGDTTEAVTIRLYTTASGVSLQRLWILPVCETSSTALFYSERAHAWLDPDDGFSRLRVGPSSDPVSSWGLPFQPAVDEIVLAPGPNRLDVWTASSEVAVTGSYHQRWSSAPASAGGS